MKAFSLKLGIVAAGFALATAPAFAQSRPNESTGGGAQAAGAVDRGSGGGAASSGGAVDRGSGGGAVTSSAGASSSVSSPSGGGTDFSSPSASAVSAPSFSAGDRAVREFAPQHRAGFAGTGFASSYSYDEGQKATPRSSGPSGGSSSGGAVSRGGGSSSGNSGGSSSGGGSGARSGSSEGAPDRSTGRVRGGSAPNESTPATNNASGAREVPTWSRPRGDRPQTGTAVDRTVPPPDHNGNNHGRYDYGYGYGYGYYDPFYGYGAPYANYYGYYPYALGFGYGLYSGLGWAPYYGDPSGDPYGGGYGGSGGYSTSYGRGEQGNLKLKVKPRGAKVYVDGYFVGYVDQFDGSFQKLALNTGRHKVEVKADGFETAEFDVLINAQQTVTFQGDLKRIQ